MNLTAELNKYLFGFLPKQKPFTFLVEEEEATVTFNFVSGTLSLLDQTAFPYIFAISNNNDVVFIIENNNKNYLFSYLNEEHNVKYLENNMPVGSNEHIKLVASIIHLIDYGYIFDVDHEPNKSLENKLYKVLEE